MTTNYTSIKSVLYNLSTVLDDRYYNESHFLEWATHGLRMMNVVPTLTTKVKSTELSDHKASLPSDLKYLLQIAFKAENDTMFQIMRPTTNTFFNSISCDDTLTSCPTCYYEFSIDPSLTLTSTLKEATLFIAYLAYPTDDEGYQLIPDDETLKEALFHYVMYKYWMTKYSMKEEGADSRMQFHLSMWTTLSRKAMNLNMPDLSDMENIRRMYSRLLPNSESYQRMFSDLASKNNGVY